MSKNNFDVIILIGRPAAGKSEVIDFLKKTNEVLQVFDFELKEYSIPAHVLKLAHEREGARKGKDWKKADELRVEIEKEGYGVTDTKGGFEVRPRN